MLFLREMTFTLDEALKIEMMRLKEISFLHFAVAWFLSSPGFQFLFTVMILSL